ncbi:Six-hairpin glycosidase-like protein [Aspergillus crustosus]
MATWIWHPEWTEEPTSQSAGASTSTLILVSVGPVKDDQHLWFYDQLDIRSHLHPGDNTINVRVLRLYYATSHATSFPRLHRPGLLVRPLQSVPSLCGCSESDGTWEAAIDKTTRLPIDDPEDDFLHIYERVDGRHELANPDWVPVEVLQFPTSHGLSAPWKLSPRAIPLPRYEPAHIKSICSVQSSLPLVKWEKVLLGAGLRESSSPSIRLPAGSQHYLELEAEAHVTCFPQFRFEWPRHAGSTLRVTYSECYEDTPYQVPYIRRKDDRRDTTKQILDEEVFAPFHMRTFRFLALRIEVTVKADLVMKHIDLTRINYPLQVLADVNVPTTGSIYQEMWTTSVRTLNNCMHDSYEDCPFYEQLQYAMYARSSALFTYCISGDDRLARQAIHQLHNSYSPNIGLTASRAPAHQPQIIPHFSLFWICMVTDHFQHFADTEFSRQFLPATDGILETFALRIEPTLGLIRSVQLPDQWDFVDWAEPWKPLGIPPAAERTGFQSYTNMLYAYTLKALGPLLTAIGRSSLAQEYQTRADTINAELLAHCFDGKFFTGGLVSTADQDADYSQNSQVWAVLCGAATDDLARDIMNACTSPSLVTAPSPRKFTQNSTAMSFYTLRALSLASSQLYESRFHDFWSPWKNQLSQNLTTWVEDSVSNRSDCHVWGSSPLFEFMVEVAGVHVSKSENKIVFRPRVGLFESFEARVPVVKGGLGKDIHVSFSLNFQDGQSVGAGFPDGHVEMVDGSSEVRFTIERD